VARKKACRIKCGQLNDDANGHISRLQVQRIEKVDDRNRLSLEAEKVKSRIIFKTQNLDKLRTIDYKMIHLFELMKTDTVDLIKVREILTTSSEDNFSQIIQSQYAQNILITMSPEGRELIEGILQITSIDETKFSEIKAILQNNSAELIILGINAIEGEIRNQIQANEEEAKSFEGDLEQLLTKIKDKTDEINNIDDEINRQVARKCN
jgi:hypothetical protein